MTIDWKLLIQVRERGRDAAQRAVAQARRESESAQAQVVQAQHVVAQQRAARDSLWADVAAAGRSGGGLSVAALRDSSVWSHTLDGDIQRAQGAAVEAEHRLQSQDSALATQRERLRRAAAELRTAEEMTRRVGEAARRAADLRLEDAADEAARQGWVAAARARA